MNGRTVRSAGLCLALALAPMASLLAEDTDIGHPENAGPDKLTLSGTTIGTIQIQPLVAKCVVSVKDTAVSGQCTKASSFPELGHLYPITQDLFISPTGEVGIGTTLPDQTLTVRGRIHSTSGGFLLPDGSLQPTMRLQGPQGPQGPQGAQGAQGAQGPAGTPGVTSLNGLSGPSVNLVAGTPNLLVGSFGNTITVSAGTTPCTYSSKTYSTGAFCYAFPNNIPCPGGFQQKKLVCQSDGRWQVISSSACNNPSLIPTCGQ